MKTNTMTKIVLTVIPVFAMALFAQAVLASTYYYVDMDGEVRTTTADNAIEARMTADDIDPNSGVLLAPAASNNPLVDIDTNEDVEVDTTTYDVGVYYYVDMNGEVRTVVADTAVEARMTADDIDPNSGVLAAPAASNPNVHIEAGEDVEV